VTDHCPLLPSFFIVGPPRTGTSWLQEVLANHTVLPKSKETRFFDTNFHRGWAWYSGNYKPPRNGRPLGEVAPTYFGFSEAQQRIARYLPGARVVCIFRHPVERVHSHYRVRCAYAMIPWSFEQAMREDPELIESTRYATHLKAWQQALGNRNVLAMIYEDLKENPQWFVDQIADFIRAPRFRLTAAEIRCVHSSGTMTYPRSFYRTRSARIMADWFKVRRLAQFVALLRKTPLERFCLGGGLRFADLTPETVDELCQRFRPEVEELERILGRELPLWKTPAHPLPSVSSETAAPVSTETAGKRPAETCVRVVAESN
jgi:hypothetical protein